MRFVALAPLGASVALAAIFGLSPSGSLAAGNEVYDLGEIHVTAPADRMQAFDSFGGSAISNATMDAFDKNNLGRAVNLVPGVASAPSGNQRNETNVFIHGFDRWQVPLSVDGVRIYLPADNRLDFSRFLTDDISEVQIAKGYVSVLDGPGGMGGAINLVTRTPSKPREGEIRTQANFGNDGHFDGIQTYFRAGSRSDHVYLQASGTLQDIHGWELSHAFEPTSVQGAGRRDWSASRDGSLNFKAGYTPNAADEYSISYLRQMSTKQAPYNVDPAASNRYWTWPYWNVQTLSGASRTELGPHAYVKTKVYWEAFDNALSMYDDPAQTQQSSGSAAYSAYHDYALGGTVEAGGDLGTSDTLKAAVTYRGDHHDQSTSYYTDQYGLNQLTSPTSVTCATSPTSFYPCVTTPKQTDLENIYSIAIENTYHATRALDLVEGVSFDRRSISQAQDYALGSVSAGGYLPPRFITYPTAASSAGNWQAAAIWRYDDAGKLYANVSDRTRFPTLFELYSTRFGSAASNPLLKPERALNTQLGWSTNYAQGSQFSAYVYYAKVENLIQSVATGATFTDPVTARTFVVTQNQNVGSGDRYGVDVAVDHQLGGGVQIGGNLSLIRSVVTNPSVPNFQLTGFPNVKGLVYASFRATESLTVTPSVEAAGPVWTTEMIPGTTTYYRTGAYALVNVTGVYRVGNGVSLSAGVQNLLDQNYALAWGYPSAGRNYFVAAKAIF